ncbi:MAG: hypothetical protein HYX79_06970 [Chloroflexi bacterium]|nr:hypothetical protein [Chloroflexota bacterium]
MKLENRKWTEDEFFAMRKEVLAQWPTGKEVTEIDKGVEYCKKLPPSKNAYLRAKLSQKMGVKQIMTSVGHATVELNHEHINYVAAAQPDNWLLFTDTYTRNNRYEQAQAGLERSRKEGFDVLNGYPLVNYGVKPTRKVTESVDGAFFSNNSDADARLEVELEFASGFTGYVENPLGEQFQHGRDFPLDKRIQYSQYTSRLAAYYEEHGVPIEVGPYANLSGWDHPGFKVTIATLGALIPIAQGCKHYCLVLGSSLNLIQDTAVRRVALKLVKEYAAKFGHPDIDVYSKGNPWMGAWPRDEAQAASVSAWPIVIAILAGFDKIFLKAIDEAHAVPTKEGHLESMKICRQLINVLGNQRLPENDELALEQEMIEKEARATIDKVIEMGDGDPAVGQVKATEAGVLDTIYSSYRGVKKNVLVVRDVHGAIRYLKHGNLPLPKEVIEYNRAKIAEREKLEGTKAGINMVINDTLFVSRNFTELAPVLK